MRKKLSTGFVVGFGGIVLFATMGPAIDGVTQALRAEYSPTIQPTIDHEVAMVFIGSPQCEFSTSAEVRTAVRALKREVVRTAREAEAEVRLVGVSVNSDPTEGVEFLSRFGQFDEITAGGFFANSAAQRYIYGDMPGVAATPQIVLIDRRADSDGPLGTFGEVVLARLSGAPSIINAVAEGLLTRRILMGTGDVP